MKAYYLHATSALAIGLSLALSAQSARAQQGGLALEEITVTARKVEENLMTVPTSVSVMSDKTVESLNIKDITQLSAFSPGFYSVNQANSNGSGMNDRASQSLIFRGFPISGGGSLFIDGAPVLSGQAPPLDTIARVEVLNGPQSAYFGRSTFIGAINFITKDPNLTSFKGSVSAEYSSYNSNDLAIALEGPLIADKLAVRINARHIFKGGQYINAANTNQRLGNQETSSLTGSVIFTPNDNLKVKAYLNYFRQDDGPAASSSIKRQDGFFNCTFTGGVYKNGYLCGEIPSLDKINPANISGNVTMTPYLQRLIVQNAFNMALPFEPGFLDGFGFKRKGVQANVRMDYDTDLFTISTLTAYNYNRTANIYDINQRDGQNIVNGYNTVLNLPNTLPYYSFQVAVMGKSEDWSQEIRFTSSQTQRLRWMVGANYIHNTSPGSTLYGQAAVGPQNLGAVTRSRISTPAVFGSGSFDITPELTLTAEARYQWDRLKNRPIYSGNTLLVGARALPLQGTFKSFSPRVSLDYKFSQDSMVYALWSRGYRPGGFNAVLQTQTPVVVAQILRAGVSGVAFRQEQLDNYEAGIKSTFLENRARATLSVYYAKWKDGQVPTVVPYLNDPNNPAAGGALLTATVNSGQANLKGVEFSGEFLVTQKLKVTAGLAVNGTKVVNFRPCSDASNITGAPNCNGNHLPSVPQWTTTASAEYNDHLVGDYDWFARLDFTHKGKVYADYTNLNWIRSSDIFNAQIGVQNGPLSIRLWVKNLTNNKQFANAVAGVDAFTFFAYPAVPNQNELRLAMPDKRTFGINARYNF